MPAIFSKNCILVGQVDRYCLVCAQHFRSEDETIAHIVDLRHTNNLKACGYFEKYKDEFIRKVKGVYFCEVCSMTFPTLTKVELHISDEDHSNLREARDSMESFKPSNNDIAFDRLLITDNAWNGVVYDTCVLCSTEFDNSTAHKASQNHILNLIKSKVEFSGNNVYRVIDEELNHCLTCNLTIKKDTLTGHFTTPEHKKAYHFNKITVEHKNTETITKSDVKNKDVIEQALQTKYKQPANSNKDSTAKGDDTNYIIDKNGRDWCIVCKLLLGESPEQHILSKGHQTLLNMTGEISTDVAMKSDVLEFVDKYQKNNVNIDFINETAFCKKCSTIIDFNTDAIESHIEEHKKTSKKSEQNAVPLPSGMKSSGSDKTTLYTKPVLLTADKGKGVQLNDYARQHKLTPNRADKSFYCNVCSRRVPASLKDLKNHVTSSGHKERVSNKSCKTQIHRDATKKVPYNEFLNVIEVVDCNVETNVVINHKYWLNTYGFCFLAKYQGNVKCYVCDIVLFPDDVNVHIITSKTRKDVITKCFFLTALENEFIREFRRGVYHCGYCSVIVLNWEGMLEHIATGDHEREKTKAERCLRNHKADQSKQIHLDKNNPFTTLF